MPTVHDTYTMTIFASPPSRLIRTCYPMPSKSRQEPHLKPLVTRHEAGAISYQQNLQIADRLELGIL